MATTSRYSPAIVECESLLERDLRKVPNNQYVTVQLTMTGRDFHLLVNDVIQNQRKKDVSRRPSRSKGKDLEEESRSIKSKYPSWSTEIVQGAEVDDISDIRAQLRRLAMQLDNLETAKPRLGSRSTSPFQAELEEDEPPSRPKKKSPPIRIIRKDSD